MKYRFIRKHATVYPVEKMCEALDVSRGGYYEWLHREPGKRAEESDKILELMKQSHTECQGMCGLDKLLGDIREKFPKCSRNRAYKLQKAHGLYSVRKRPFRVCLTDSNHDLPIAENLLNQKFDISEPGKVWVTDITQLTTDEGTLYLATVKDICTKEIVGWSVADHMRKELCIDALENAFKRHRPAPGLIHHSDRGSQYCSHKYQEKLTEYKMRCSMSRKGNCWDNACAETFFSTIKSERLHHKTYKTFLEAHQDIFWYIESFYNRRRRHQALGNQTIPEFKRRLEMKVAA
jgi:putative transposase